MWMGRTSREDYPSGSREDRERRDPEQTDPSELGEFSKKPTACLEAAQPPDTGILPRGFWESRALPTPCFPRKQSHQTVMGLEASQLIPTGLSCSSDEGFYLK